MRIRHDFLRRYYGKDPSPEARRVIGSLAGLMGTEHPNPEKVLLALTVADALIASVDHPPTPQVQGPSRQEAVPGAARGDMPPDWKAAYLLWGREMRKRLEGDEAALRTFRAAEVALWDFFEAEVDGR